MPASLWTGVALGLSVAVPVGPMALLCVQNTLTGGYGQGVVTGLGAATAHGMFATAAVLGAGATTPLFTPWTDVIRGASSALLIMLGVRTLVRQGMAGTGVRTTTWRASYSSTLVLALSNPMTVLPYIAVATASVGDAVDDASLSTWSILGVVLAASSWYAGISGLTSLMRRGMPPPVVRCLNIAVGSAMVLCGLTIASGMLPHLPCKGIANCPGASAGVPGYASAY